MKFDKGAGVGIHTGRSDARRRQTGVPAVSHCSRGRGQRDAAFGRHGNRAGLANGKRSETVVDKGQWDRHRQQKTQSFGRHGIAGDAVPGAGDQRPPDGPGSGKRRNGSSGGFTSLARRAFSRKSTTPVFDACHSRSAPLVAPRAPRQRAFPRPCCRDDRAGARDSGRSGHPVRSDRSDFRKPDFVRISGVRRLHDTPEMAKRGCSNFTDHRQSDGFDHRSPTSNGKPGEEDGGTAPPS